MKGMNFMEGGTTRERNAQIGGHRAGEEDTKLSQLMSALSAGQVPTLTFTCFIPDEKKAGGSYRDVTGKVKKVDNHRKEITLYAANGISDGESIQIKWIYDIKEP